jgi:transposase-like protein
MVLEPVECPVCGGTNVIKHGKSGEGKQRYLCQDQGGAFPFSRLKGIHLL